MAYQKKTGSMLAGLVHVSCAAFRIIAVGSLLSFAVSNVSADIIARYTFADSSFAPADTDGDVAASSLTPVSNNTPSPFGFSTVTPSNSGSAQAYSPTYYVLNTATPNSSTAANDYLQFTIKINEGSAVDLTMIGFDHAATGVGLFTSNWEIRYSLDDFVSTSFVLGISTKSGTLEHDYVRFSQHISVPALKSLKGPAAVTFRIYAFDTTDTNGVNRIDNITLEGKLSTIPDPSIYDVSLKS